MYIQYMYSVPDMSQSSIARWKLQYFEKKMLASI